MSVGVWRSLLSHSLWSCQLVCDCARVSACVCLRRLGFFFVVFVLEGMCEVRLGCGLLLWFSGTARGVGVTFSPSLSSICRVVGVTSLRGSLLAPGAALSSEHADLRSAREVKT